jgi:hypothetical protein
MLFVIILTTYIFKTSPLTRSPVRVTDAVDFLNLPNPSNRIMALGSTQPLTEMSTRNFPGDKKRQARRADNLAAFYEPNV